MSQPTNLPEQMAAARVLLDTVGASLVQDPDWAAIVAAGPAEQAVNRLDSAIRRLSFVEFDALPDGERLGMAAGLAVCMGMHIGMLLRGAPPAVAQTALTEVSKAMLEAIGADPLRSGVCVTVSQGQQKEPLH